MRLDGRVAIVTGGAGGIGRGIVRAFTDEGASVVFADINAEAGRALEQELPGRAKYVDIDIAQAGSAEKICAAAIETFGALHILVNNAHASRQAPLVDTTQEMFDLSFDTGFYPTVRLMQAAYPHLRETAGTVINFASGAGIEGQATQASYAAAKEAIRAVSRVAANEWAADNITVNVISPLALTEGVRAYIEANPGVEDAMLSRVPLRRFGDPQQDIGRVAVFLASADADYMTGQTLMVDGGTQKLR
ncbi:MULTISPECIES: SDR family NAD(P)-dependent oxidoreductase [Nocardia]|uniref:SDR family NAD(P)-dependent oxidoreductase n=1 Tax=Nocardia TaxID=1817 RepID=UPI001894D2DB|nr:MULTISPECIES: SDR family oxidoreductase [Nocardia]MBF6347453.1 SDR family oxidoreductase [Nocardia flavorosea]